MTKWILYERIDEPTNHIPTRAEYWINRVCGWLVKALFGGGAICAAMWAVYQLAHWQLHRGGL